MKENTMAARALFTGIASRYEAPAGVLSFWQYRRWHRALVRALGLGQGARVLDVATGTGLIAADIERAYGATVTGIDLTHAMLQRARLRDRVTGDARALPFEDERFDAVTFSYLLRYVDDPESALREMARVLRPGGVLGSVEFGVPSSAPLKALWKVYATKALPILAMPLGDGWQEVGRFLGPSIIEWDAAWPLGKQLAAWDRCDIDVARVVSPSFGAGVVIVGRKR